MKVTIVKNLSLAVFVYMSALCNSTMAETLSLAHEFKPFSASNTGVPHDNIIVCGDEGYPYTDYVQAFADRAYGIGTYRVLPASEVELDSSMLSSNVTFAYFGPDLTEIEIAIPSCLSKLPKLRNFVLNVLVSSPRFRPAYGIVPGAGKGEHVPIIKFTDSSIVNSKVEMFAAICRTGKVGCAGKLMPDLFQISPELCQVLDVCELKQ